MRSRQYRVINDLQMYVYHIHDWVQFEALSLNSLFITSSLGNKSLVHQCTTRSCLDKISLACNKLIIERPYIEIVLSSSPATERTSASGYCAAQWRRRAMNHTESDSSIPLRTATLEPIGFDGSRSRSTNLSPTSGMAEKNASAIRRKREKDTSTIKALIATLRW